MMGTAGFGITHNPSNTSRPISSGCMSLGVLRPASCVLCTRNPSKPLLRKRAAIVERLGIDVDCPRRRRLFPPLDGCNSECTSSRRVFVDVVQSFCPRMKPLSNLPSSSPLFHISPLSLSLFRVSFRLLKRSVRRCRNCLPSFRRSKPPKP